MQYGDILQHHIHDYYKIKSLKKIYVDKMYPVARDSLQFDKD